MPLSPSSLSSVPSWVVWLLPFVSVAILVLLLDLMLRGWWAIAGATPKDRPFSSEIHQFDTEVGWTLKPGKHVYDTTEINSHGFRSTTELPPIEDRPRVMLLGDSMVYGAGEPTENIFSELLNRDAAHYYVNTASIGYSTGQELLIQRRWLSKIKPDLVILFYTQANDLWTNTRGDDFYPKFYLDSKDNLKFEIPKRINVQPWLKKSPIYVFFLDKLLMGKDLEFIQYRIDFAIRGKNSAVWKVQDRLLSEIIEGSVSEGIPFLVIDIPNYTGHQKTRSSVREALVKKSVLKSNGNYQNLLELYPKDYHSSMVQIDGAHWNAKGHQFIKKVVQQQVELLLRRDLTGSSLPVPMDP